jgi:hypothetical protein
MMKGLKAPPPTIFYPDEHELLASEFDKVLSSKEVKINLSKIDSFLSPLLGTKTTKPTTGRKPRKK